MDNQQQIMDKNALYARGYTISGAARALCISANHLSCVLRGERKSAILMQRLLKLPLRPLRLREKLTN